MFRRDCGGVLSDLRRNIGDRDATAEQLLNKVMTLQLKLEEKMFAESMMHRARQRQRSKIVAPVRSEKKSLWKRVFGAEALGEDGEELDSPEASRGGTPPTSSKSGGVSASPAKGGQLRLSTMEKQGWSTDGIGGGELPPEHVEFLRKEAAKKAAAGSASPGGAGSPGSNGRSLFAAGGRPAPTSSASSAAASGGEEVAGEAAELARRLETAERQKHETERERVRAEEERERLESERANMMQLLKQKTEAVRNLETKATETQDVLSMRNDMHKTELERVQQRLDDAEAMIADLRADARDKEEVQYGSTSPREAEETVLERDRLRAELSSKSTEVRQLMEAKRSLEADLKAQEAGGAGAGGLQAPPVVMPASPTPPQGGGEDKDAYVSRLEQRTAQLEATVSEQTAAGTEEKKRLRELVDANTRDLAELSAEWGQRNQLQEARIHELLLQSENAAKDARRLKELLDKRTSKNKDLQYELDDAQKSNGGVVGDTDAKVKELTSRLAETKRQRKTAQQKQEATQSTLSEKETRVMELEADNRALVAEVTQSKEQLQETSRTGDEEVRHLRQQVEQLILSFNSAQSAPPSASPSPLPPQEAEPPMPMVSAPPVSAAAAAPAAEPMSEKEREAATHVQSVWRGFTDRRKLSDLMEDLGYFDEGGDFSLTSFHYVRLSLSLFRL